MPRISSNRGDIPRVAMQIKTDLHKAMNSDSVSKSDISHFYNQVMDLKRRREEAVKPTSFFASLAAKIHGNPETRLMKKIEKLAQKNGINMTEVKQDQGYGALPDSQQSVLMKTLVLPKGVDGASALNKTTEWELSECLHSCDPTVLFRHMATLEKAVSSDAKSLQNLLRLDLIMLGVFSSRPVEHASEVSAESADISSAERRRAESDKQKELEGKAAGAFESIIEMLVSKTGGDEDIQKLTHQVNLLRLKYVSKLDDPLAEGAEELLSLLSGTKTIEEVLGYHDIQKHWSFMHSIDGDPLIMDSMDVEKLKSEITMGTSEGFLEQLKSVLFDRFGIKVTK